MLRHAVLHDYKLYLLSDGLFSLDGGAMFGVVPKVLWQKSIPSDTLNRIQLGLNCLVIVTPKHNLLVDTGLGEVLDPKFRDIYAISRSTSLLESLGELGLMPEDIDFVINTHLHFDHAGGNTRRHMENTVPTFPKASYVIQKGEWKDAITPNDRTRGSYLEDNFLPLEEAGKLQLIEGAREIVEGVEVLVTGGHTAHHQVVLIRRGDQVALYLGDLIPTSHHLKIPWLMGYDLYPLDTVVMKKRLLERALNEHWLLVFEHDPKVGMGYLVKRDDTLMITEEHR